MWEEKDLITFTLKKLMDFKIAARPKDVSAPLGVHFGVSCKVVACMDDLL